MASHEASDSQSFGYSLERYLSQPAGDDPWSSETIVQAEPVQEPDAGSRDAGCTSGNVANDPNTQCGESYRVET
jgi:hypothetical protein